MTAVKSPVRAACRDFLGIFNAASFNQFIAESTVDFSRDTHEIVFSDETLQVVDNNLDADKLRKLVLKDITVTLPASANTKDVKTPITIAFFDREGTTSPSKMRQFANVLQGIDAPSARAAQALLPQQFQTLRGLLIVPRIEPRPAQCRQLFIDANDKGHDWAFYIGKICSTEKTILAGLAEDPEGAPIV